MSVINEALKRAGEPEKKQSQAPARQVSSPKPARPLSTVWLVAIFAVLIAMASLYANELGSRQKAQAKLQAALLQLNDARSQAMEEAQQKSRALAEKAAIAAKKQEVEYDNFEKEKKISDLSKEIHELKMSGSQSSQPAQA